MSMSPTRGRTNMTMETMNSQTASSPASNELERRVADLQGEVETLKAELAQAQQNAAYWMDKSIEAAPPRLVNGILLDGKIVGLCEVASNTNLGPGKRLSATGVWTAPVTLRRAPSSHKVAEGEADVFVVGGGLAFIPPVRNKGRK